MIGTARLAKAIGRAVFALLLALAATAPSLAELGVLESPSAHRQGTGVAHESPSMTSEQPDGDDSDKGGAASHCQFTHCAHVVPSRPPERAADEPHRPGLAYPVLVSHRLAAAPRDGPEHPPRV